VDWVRISGILCNTLLLFELLDYIFLASLLKYVCEAPKSSYSEFLGPYVAVRFFWGQSCLCLKPKLKKKGNIYLITGHEGPEGE
jgi:hypothetical protein